MLKHRCSLLTVNFFFSFLFFFEQPWFVYCVQTVKRMHVGEDIKNNNKKCNQQVLCLVL